MEIGCGGGQNSIVLAKWGAHPVGLDISEVQIKCARKLAEKERVKVLFHVGDMKDLSIFDNSSSDVVLSSFALDYVDDLQKTLQETFRVLRNLGLFVFAVVHPIAHRGRVVRYGKRRTWAVGNYFDRGRRAWEWRIEGGAVRFVTGQVTLQDYFDLLINTGFVVERILEPEPYDVDRLTEQERRAVPYISEYYSKYYDVWSKVPYTIIFKAKKTRSLV